MTKQMKIAFQGEPGANSDEACRAHFPDYEPYACATFEDAFEAVKSGAPNSMKMGGTGSKQEDQIITVALERATATKFTYIPFKGGGEVAVQLVGQHVNSTVNNPIEAVAQWRGGAVRPLCVFDGKPLPYKDSAADGKSWGDIPTCKSQGLDVEYVMLRGIFMPPGVTPDQVKYYTDLFAKVRALPEWKEFMEKGAFNQTALSGAEYVKWVAANEALRVHDADWLRSMGLSNVALPPESALSALSSGSAAAHWSSRSPKIGRADV